MPFMTFFCSAHGYRNTITDSFLFHSKYVLNHIIINTFYNTDTSRFWGLFNWLTQWGQALWYPDNRGTLPGPRPPRFFIYFFTMGTMSPLWHFTDPDPHESATRYRRNVSTKMQSVCNDKHPQDLPPHASSVSSTKRWNRFLISPCISLFPFSLLSLSTVDPAVQTRWLIMDEHVIHQTEHMTTIEASAVSQQVHQVHL